MAITCQALCQALYMIPSHLSFTTTIEMEATISPILQMRKMRHSKDSNLPKVTKLLVGEPDFKASSLVPRLVL